MKKCSTLIKMHNRTLNEKGKNLTDLQHQCQDLRLLLDNQYASDTDAQ